MPPVNVLVALALAAACSRPPPNEAPGEVAVAKPPADAATPIRLTARAATMIKQVQRDEGVTLPLRIEVRLGGPPPGIEYLLYFDDTRPTDQRFEIDGVTVIVDGDSVKHVTGTEIDFIETAKGAGFKLDNPNVARLRSD